MRETSTVGTNAHNNGWALVFVHIGVLLDERMGTLHGAKQEEDGYCEGFINVEEILGGSFGVYEVSDCIQALYIS